MASLMLFMALAAAAPTGASRSAVADLAAGHRAFRAGQYPEALRRLAALPGRLPHARDYILYLAAESAFYAGEAPRARALFSALARERGSRFAAIAAWRMADCLWTEGRRDDAARAYRKLLGKTPAAGDTVVARFRVAERSGRQEAERLFRRIHIESPAHPLAEDAERRARSAGVLGTAVSANASRDAQIAPRERLRRAARLAEDKRWQEALAELDRLSGDLPTDMRVERDFQVGMAKYRMRRDYPGAAERLLGVAAHLPEDKAAFAAFHGARALSRADRDDEAIAEYKRVVERFPSSRWAAEAQFLAGWLDFNRGRFRESIPGLRATLVRFARSAFANDAAWFLTLAQYFSGQSTEALSSLAEYLRLSHGNPEAERRALYWRARIFAQGGRDAEALSSLAECARRFPLDWYGLLARARLRAAGVAPSEALATRDIALPPPKPSALAREPAVVRAEVLAAAGLLPEAGVEMVRAEDTLTKNLGRDQALALLLDRLPRWQAYRRAFQLAEARGAVALAAAPVGAARVVWEAAYPRAYRDLVERHGPAQGNPDFFLYAIMRKESSYAPHEVSYADARGLLQMIPATSAQVARGAGVTFELDELFDVETNIRLGAAYIGGLVKRFGGQLFLAAGAYNAGSGPMMRWCDRNGARPIDEFVELVTYEQSREYIKRVMGIYARYQYLYGGTVYEPPLAVDPKYIRGPTEE